MENHNLPEPVQKITSQPITSTTPPTSRHSNHGVMILLTIIIFLLGGGLAFLYIQNTLLQQGLQDLQTQQNKIQLASPETTTVATSPKDPVTSWNTHTEKEFSIKYPPEVNVTKTTADAKAPAITLQYVPEGQGTEFTEGINIVITWGKINKDNHDFLVDASSSNTAPLTAEDYAETRHTMYSTKLSDTFQVTPLEQTTLANYPATSFSVTGGYSNNADPEYYLDHNELIYFIQVFASHNDAVKNTEYQQTASQILTTLKFN